jgi:broad specificity phosphatase PhoE
MNLTLYLLRHGETVFSRDNAFSGSEFDAGANSADFGRPQPSA